MSVSILEKTALIKNLRPILQPVTVVTQWILLHVTLLLGDYPTDNN